jgi:hypothetical protein
VCFRGNQIRRVREGREQGEEKDLGDWMQKGGGSRDGGEGREREAESVKTLRRDRKEMREREREAESVKALRKKREERRTKDRNLKKKKKMTTTTTICMPSATRRKPKNKND